MKATEILDSVRTQLENRLKRLIEERGGEVEFNIVWDKDEDDGKEDIYFADLPVEFYICDDSAQSHYIYSVEYDGNTLFYTGIPANYDDYQFTWVEVSVIARMIDLIEERLK